MFNLQFSQSEYLADLKTALLHEFDALYKKYQNQGIYAFSLVIDELMVAQYTTVSTHKSLLNEAENRFQYLAEVDKWNIDRWQYRAETQLGLPFFTRKMSEYFQKTRLNLTQIHSKARFDDNALNFYIQGLEEVKDEILDKYNIGADKITFLVHLASNPQIALTSLEKLNPPSSNLYEAIANVKSNQISKGVAKTRLSQIDKDILIDLGQSLEIEPYDDLQIAQLAYLLTLEPYFLETSPFIQRLINDIAAMDAGILVMTKLEIQNRINQFYLSS